jgi:hypothetical protein
MISGKSRVRAKIFSSGSAKFALLASGLEPGDPDSIPFFELLDSLADSIHDADGFMAGDNGAGRAWKFTLDDMQIGAAHSADGHLDPHLAVTRIGEGKITHL